MSTIMHASHFKMANCQAGSGAGARQADEILGGNVGDEERGDEGEPLNVPASQEIGFSLREK